MSKSSKRGQAEPNVAGLVSQAQQAEMKSILAGTWPPFKPLPVFKYETDEYRAEIHFDKARGEWVCRKTSLPSNMFQELRGGLTELTMALPRGKAEVFTEFVAAEHQEQESENEANRRLQAILEWRKNCGNGALYSELQAYLSESQRDEINDIIRMSLTARQLQFGPKNVAFVFDALLNAGGRLTTLIEIAQRKKAEQVADAQASEAAALEAERQSAVGAIHSMSDRRLQTRTTPASLAYAMFGDTNGGIVVNISEMGMAIAVVDPLVLEDYLPRIRFQLPRSRQSIEISAQIMWLAESKKSAGIRFVDLTADARNQISNWIESEKLSSESNQLPKLPRRDQQLLEISARKFGRISSNPSVRDEEVATRYAEMFPSESPYAEHSTPVDEIKLQQGPLPIPAASPTTASVSVFGSASEISTGGAPESLAVRSPSERAKDFVPEPVKSSITELSEILTPELIARTAPLASEIVTREGQRSSARSLVEDIPEKVDHHARVGVFGSRVRREGVESSADRIEDSRSHFYALEIPRFQVAAFACLFAVIGIAAGLTVGDGPLGKLLRYAQKSMLPADATSLALPHRPGESTSQTPTPPAPETEESRSESTSAQSLNRRPADSVTNVGPIGRSPVVTSRSLIGVDSPSGPNKLDDATPSEDKSNESPQDFESFAKVPSPDSNSSRTIEAKPSANPEASLERNGSTGLIGQNAPPAASPKALGPRSGALRNPVLRRLTPATGAALYASRPSVILLTAPAEGGNPIRLIFPEKPIAACSSFAIKSQLSILVSPEPGPVVVHRPARLQAGQLVSYVWPQYPRSGGRYKSMGSVKLRATIGQLGQVLNIRPVSGSTSLLTAAMSAIRQWRYQPTLLNQRPMQAQQDVTILFRPPQYLSHLATHHPSPY